MLQTLKNAWRTQEIRKKILFTIMILLLYRIGTVIPVPFVDSSNFSQNFGGTILDYMNILSGGSLATATLFALGVQPYINASIIIQLLAVAFPKLGELAKSGDEGKKKMNMITRITTIVIALITAIGYYMLLSRNGMLTASAQRGNSGFYWFVCAAIIVVCYCAGASLIMWLGEKINDKGIGNGISMILFANIVSTIPSFLIKLVSLVVDCFSYDSAYIAKCASVAIVFALFIIAFIIATFVFIIYITVSERRIPIQYAKRVVGRKMYGGQSSNLPIKLNMTGVMPIIFASSIVSLPITIMALCNVSASGTGFWSSVYRVLNTDGAVYPICLFLLIIFFTYFYTQISFNPIEIANNLKKQGGVIHGIRQGRPTAEYISKILSKITLVGALFLGIIAIIPTVGGPLVVEPILRFILSGSLEGQYAASNQYYQLILDSEVSSFASAFTFGGTTLLIMVGVALETFRELEAQLTMRSYKGFLN